VLFIMTDHANAQALASGKKVGGQKGNDKRPGRFLAAGATGVSDTRASLGGKH